MDLKKKWFIDNTFCDCDLFYQHVLTLIAAWISNHMLSKVRDEATYLFPNFNFNGTAFEILEWIGCFTTHFILDAITSPRQD